MPFGSAALYLQNASFPTTFGTSNPRFPQAIRIARKREHDTSRSNHRRTVGGTARPPVGHSRAWAPRHLYVRLASARYS